MSEARILAWANPGQVPVMALRPDHRFPKEMDDIVVEDVKMFRAEAMSNNQWWMCCRFHNDEEITFWITRASKPARISVTVTEEPSEWLNWDDLHRQGKR